MREKETKYAIKLSALAKLLCQQCIHCDDDDPRKLRPSKCPQVGKFIKILKEKSQ